MTDLLDEAVHIIECLWTMHSVHEVALDCIPTVDVDGVPMIVSTVTGEVLWSGGNPAWAWAMWLAAKRIHENGEMSTDRGIE